MRKRQNKFCNDDCATNALLRALAASTVILLVIVLWLAVRVSSNIEKFQCRPVPLSKHESEQRLEDAFDDMFGSLCDDAMNSLKQSQHNASKELYEVTKSEADKAQRDLDGTIESLKNLNGAGNNVYTNQVTFRLQGPGLLFHPLDSNWMQELGKAIALDRGNISFPIR